MVVTIGTRVHVPEALGKISRLMMVAKRALFPADWSPITQICGIFSATLPEVMCRIPSRTVSVVEYDPSSIVKDFRPSVVLRLGIQPFSFYSV